MYTTRADVDALTERVIGAAIEVHRTLGPGLLEGVYRECLIMELATAGLSVQRERRVPLEYKGRPLQGALRLDLVIEESLVVELKAVDVLHSGECQNFCV